jgi:putative pyruvate formate lyase activating enzyme
MSIEEMTGKYQPRYIENDSRKVLAEKRKRLEEILEHCSLCPWNCGVNRKENEQGRCRAGNEIMIAKALPHFGEEPVLTGTRGSGTIFFTHCHLRCKFCQNYQISQENLGEKSTSDELASIMLSLQEQGCHNINLVSPTHFLPHIVAALEIAIPAGLSLPLVYNSNGYERVETLELLDGIIDIYLPDAKYADDNLAQSCSRAQGYVFNNLSSLQEMYRQVGKLRVNQEGVAERGLIIRHLVLPRHISNTRNVLRSIRDLLGNEIHISLMGQYFPTHQVLHDPLLNRRLTDEEYREAINLLEDMGFVNGWLQEPDQVDRSFVPDFTKSESWN